MDQTKLHSFLQETFSWPISSKKAWNTYENLLELFKSEDLCTTLYLCHIIELTSCQRKIWRNKLAESGFELRPDELNQIIFLLMLAMEEYIECYQGK